MSLNVILGKSNTGKSEYMYKKIMACEECGKQAILFVPPSGRLVAEEEYLQYTNKKALIDTTITSIERFVNRRVDKTSLYQDKAYLKDLAKKMMVKKTIIENPDMFKVFSKVKDTVGFADKIMDYMQKFDELKALDELDKYEEQDFLKTKLSEFKQIYLKLQETLQDKFIESIDEMKSYINLLNSSDINLVNADIFIDNYNNFSNIEYEFISALLLNGNNVCITLDIDKDKYLNGVTEIYNTSYNTLLQFKEICANIGVQLDITNLSKTKDNTKKDIYFLANNIFNLSGNVYDEKVQNVKLALTSNTYEEIKYIAEDILSKIKQNYLYGDIAIYTNNIETYEIYIKKIMDIYNIPIYINQESGIMNNGIVICLSELLKLVQTGFGKSIEGLLNLLKTHMLNLTDEQIYLFENYVVEFGIKGYNLLNEFVLNNGYDIDELNNIRSMIVDKVDKLKAELKNKKTSKEITEVIYNYLIEENIIAIYEQNLNSIKEVDSNEYKKGKQVLAKLYEIMDNICIAYEEITLKEYAELLEYGSKEIKIDTIPAKLNQIEVIDINWSRGNSKKIAYIIGCYDGGLPTIQSEDNIFTDIELEKLKAVGIDLKQTSDERNNMQLFNIYQTINKVRDALIFTVPSSSSSGASLRPSSLIQEIKTILDIQLESIKNENTLNMSEDFMQFMSKLSLIDENTPKDEIEELYFRMITYEDIPKYNEILNYKRHDDNLSEQTLRKLYGKEINSSVSKLEQFKRCPFSYYAKYILNLKEPKTYVMTSLDTGSFMHEVIEKFSKFIVAKNIAWQDLVLNENKKELAIKTVNEIVDKLFEEEYSKYLTNARYSVLKIRMKKAMQRTIFAIADSFNHSEFRPLGYEIQFEKGELFAPIEVELENGKKLLLRGKIDRIDSLAIENNTYLRIVDYKSSDKDLKLSDVKSGISLQLMTYMCAMLENKEKLGTDNVIPVALSYFTMSNKILSITNYEANDSKIAEMVRKALKLKGIYIKDIEILKKLDNNVENGKDSYLDVSSRTINNKNKVLPQEVFIDECNNVRGILKEIGKEILKGNVKIKPSKDIANVCDYCSYSSMCRNKILN